MPYMSMVLLLLPQALGVAPKPIFPALSNLATSAPPSAKAMVSAAGKKMPVLASVPLMAGAAAVPSTSDKPFVPSRIKLIYSFYKTTQREPVGTVTVMLELTVMGPVLIAFLLAVMV